MSNGCFTAIVTWGGSGSGSVLGEGMQGWQGAGL